MGVLRKKPGDKVEISPIKLWGIVSLVALCLGFGAALIGRASAQPIPSFITGENMSQENQVLDGTYVYREGCPESEDSRLRSVCGTVLSAKLEQEKGISDTFTTVTKPVENISVYAYEFDPDTDTGFDEFGRLERPFASTSTNEAGKYHLQYRASGSKNSLIAIVYMCNDSMAALKLVNSGSEYYKLDALVHCDDYDSLSYTPPPVPFAVTSRKFGSQDDYAAPDNYQECEIEGSRATETGFLQGGGEVVNTEIKYEDYDDRFAPFPGFEFFGFKFGAHEGAWWEEDCILKPHLSHEDCAYGSRADDGSGGAMSVEDYITRPFHNSIPKVPVSRAYMRIEHRFETKQINASPRTGAQMLQNLLGDCAWNVYVRMHGSSTQGKLISCEEFLMCNSTVTGGDASVLNNYRNTKTSYAPAATLGHPGTWRKIYNNEPTKPGDYAVKACNFEGRDIKIEEIQPPWDTCDMDVETCTNEITGATFVLPKEYFNPILAFPRGAGALKSETQNVQDSLSSSIREKPWTVEEAIEDPYLTKSFSVFNSGGEESNYNNSISRVYRAAAAFADDDILTNVIKSPGSEREEYAVGMEVTDIGNDSLSLCNLSRSGGSLESFDINPGNEAGVIRNNIFDGNENHTRFEDVDLGAAGAGSGSFYSNLGRDREKTLNEGKTFTITKLLSLKGWAKMVARDTYDSLRTALAGDTKGFDLIGPTWQALKGALFDSGPTKSWTQRKDYGIEARDDIVVRYKLHEGNFKQYFPIPTSPYLPGSWGTHGSYPWNSLGDGEECNSYREPDVSRTCRVDSCTYVVWGNKCFPDGRCEDYRDESDCSERQRKQCAIGQKNTSVSLSKGSGVECRMSRAGPYIEEPDLEVEVVGEVTHETDEFPAEPSTVSANMMASVFRSPNSQVYFADKGGFVDTRTSEKPSDPASYITGYVTKVPGTGSVTDAIRPVTSPVLIKDDVPFNVIRYHCSDFNFNVSGVVEDGSWSCQGAEVISGECKGEAWEQISGRPDASGIQSQAFLELNGLMANYQSSPEIIAAYAYAEKQTGVPCEVLAGIHSVEGKGNATQGLQEGQAISVSELPASALRAAQMLQDAANANVTAGFTSDSNLSNYQTLVAALSTYNAGGNLQCWVGPNRCGEAVPIPPYQFSGGCPPKYPAEDSLYALSLLDPRHAAMYLRYCADDGPDANDCGELCPTPVLWNRPGAITVAVWFYENISTQP